MHSAPLFFALVLALNADPIAAPRSRSISLVDYAFGGLPGETVAEPPQVEQWTIRNAGRALHQIQVLHLPDSNSLPAVEEWIARGASPLLPPAPLVVNVSALLPGAEATQRVNLRSGVYVVLCFVPAGRDSSRAIVPHVHLGMRQTFVVR